MVRRTVSFRENAHCEDDNRELKSRSPQPVTRGLHHDFFTEDSIDWLSLTFPSLEHVNYPSWYESRAIHGKGMLGYKNSRRFKDGRIELYDPDRPDMGVHVIMSSQCIQNNAGIGITELNIFRESKAVVRRIDFARDIYNSPLSFGVLLSHLSRGKANTKARLFPAYQANGRDGRTQYIGKKSSDCYVRIYDKAYEQGIPGLWHRIEVVFQDEKAEPATRAFIAGESVPSLLRGVIDFPEYRIWDSVLSQSGSTSLHVGRKNGNTREWLLTQVAPAMASELFLDSDENFLVEWLTKVRLLKEALEERSEPFRLT